MVSTIWQRLEQIAQRLLPFLTVLLFVLSSVMMWPLPYMGAVAPSLGLIAVYYWAMHRPDLLRPTHVFFIGLLHDAINQLPFGLSAMILVATYQLVLSQRRFFVGHSFLMTWTGFGIIAILAMMCHWLVLSIYEGHWAAFQAPFVQAIFTIAIFPVPVWGLIRLQRSLLSQG